MSEKPTSRSTPWHTVLVVCRKCGKKLDGGFGRKRQESLRTVLRQTLREAGMRRGVRICETGCLGLCPKDAVTALNASRPGTIHAIPAGTDAAETVRTLIGLETGGNAGGGIEGA